METFDELFDKAKTFVDIASKKTSDAVELARLRMNRAQLNGDMQKAYEKLGAFVYKFRKSGEENQDLINICVEEIDELLRKMDDIADKINIIKSSIKCPECCAVNDDESIYCAKCGARMAGTSEPDSTPVEQGVVDEATVVDGGVIDVTVEEPAPQQPTEP